MHLANIRVAQLPENPGMVEIYLEGNLDINSAEMIHKQFVRALKRYQQIKLEICNVEKVDISFVQIYYAFLLAANKQGVVIHNHVELDDDLTLLLERSGIDLQLIPEAFDNNKPN